LAEAEVISVISKVICPKCGTKMKILKTKSTDSPFLVITEEECPSCGYKDYALLGPSPEWWEEQLEKEAKK